MPDYVYVLGDILDPSTFYGELELSNVTCDRQLSQVGNLSGSFSMLDRKSQLILSNFFPGKRSVYAYRDGDCIWGGILWGYQYMSDQKSFTLSASTWESWFDHVALEDIDFVTTQLFGGTADNPTNSDVMIWLVSKLNTLTNIGVSVNSPYAYKAAASTNNPSFPATAIPGYEYHMASEIIQTLQDNGAVYYIDPLTRVLYFDPQTTNNVYREYEYPGGISNYVLSNTSTSAAVRFGALGAGSGNQEIRTAFDSSEGSDATWPNWYKILTNPNIGTVEGLTTWAKAQATNYAFSVQSLPTFICNPDKSKFDLWNKLGASVTVNIQDIRTNQIRTPYTDQLVGWQLTPQSSTNEEQLQFVLGKSLKVGQ